MLNNVVYVLSGSPDFEVILTLLNSPTHIENEV